jgi:hypothetical protein
LIASRSGERLAALPTEVEARLGKPADILVLNSGGPPFGGTVIPIDGDPLRSAF